MSSLFDDQPLDEDKDFFNEYVGDGKKYKTPADLAKAYYHADKTIEVFKREKDQYRQDYEDLKKDLDQRAKLQDMIDQLSKAQPSPASSEITPAKEEVKPVSLDEYKKLVREELSTHEVQKRQDENFNQVQNELKKRYGSRYQDVLEKQMVELGINKDFVDFNARNNPRALLKMLGEAPTQETFQAPPRSSKSPFPSARPNEKRTWSWYQNLRKNDPATYRNPKTSVQMIKDYETLGKDFEDGDFEQGYL